MAEPIWNDQLNGYLLQQQDGSTLISRRQADGTSGAWEPYVQPSPQPAAPAPQPQPQPAVAPQAMMPQPMVMPQPTIVQPVMQPTMQPAMQPGVMPMTQPTPQTGIGAGMQQIMGSPVMSGNLLQSIDLSDVQEGGRLIQPEGSIVVATVTPDTVLEKSSTNEDMIHLILKVDYTVPPGGVPTEEFKGLRVDDNVVLTVKARWKFKNVMRVLGLLDPSGARFIGNGVQDMWGKQVAFIGKHHEYNNRSSNKPAGNYEVPQIMLGTAQAVAQAMPQPMMQPIMQQPPMVAQQPMMQPAVQMQPAPQPAYAPPAQYAQPAYAPQPQFAQPIATTPMPMTQANLPVGQPAPDFPMQPPQ